VHPPLRASQLKSATALLAFVLNPDVAILGAPVGNRFFGCPPAGVARRHPRLVKRRATVVPYLAAISRDGPRDWARGDPGADLGFDPADPVRGQLAGFRKKPPLLKV
jgi:hypothetical protein